jgi:hypothetical protein
MAAERSSACEEDAVVAELMEEIENESVATAASVSVVKANERSCGAKQPQSEDGTSAAGNNDKEEKDDDVSEEQDSDSDDNQFMDAMENDEDENEPRVAEKREDAIARATVGKPVADPNPQLEAENCGVVDASRQDSSTEPAESLSAAAADRSTATNQVAAFAEAAPAVVTRKESTDEEKKKPARVVAVEQDATSLRPTVQSTPSSNNKPFVPLAPPKNWRTMALRSNGKINRIVQAALLKTLLHAIRRGSAEGVRVAIERGVVTQYIDNRGRNLVM